MQKEDGKDNNSSDSDSNSNYDSDKDLKKAIKLSMQKEDNEVSNTK